MGIHDDTHSPPPVRSCSAGSAFMKLANLIGSDQVILDMKAVEHWPAIEELVDHLVQSGLLPESHRPGALEALKAREEQVSTGIGSGVAIPHAFSDELDEVVAVFGRSKSGIDFEAIDNSPVHYIILFIVPRKDYHLHLRTLAAIAKMFTNCEIRRQLGAAETRDEILAILDSKPSRAATPEA
jgi:mannitol/fructose-specific phosphotransferase system IIA component (Ntr-type)